MSPRPEDAPVGEEAEALLGRALAHAATRDGVARALAALRGLVRRRPGHRDAVLHLARLERNAGRPGAARRCLEHYAAREGRDAEALALLGSVCRAQGDGAGARLWLERAVEVGAPAPEALLELVQLYLEQGLVAAARAVSTRARTTLGGRPEPRLVEAMIDQREGRSERALEVLGELVERFPDCHAALAARAEVERALGDHDRARLSLRRAMLIAPDRAAYRRRLARLAGDDGREAAAAAPPAGGAWDRLELKAAIQERARRHREQGTLRAGIRELTALSTRCRFEPLVWFELARLTHAAGEPRRALVLAQRALELEPEAAAFRVEVARLLVETSRPADAVTTLAGLDAEGTRRLDARLVAVRADEALGRTEAAARGYAELLAADPGLRVARLGLFRLAQAAGRLEEAEGHLAKALAGGPPEPELAAARVALLDRLGRGAEAERQLEACAAAHPERTDVALELARRRLAAGRTRAALEGYRALARRAPAEGREARLDLAEALLALRRPRAASRLIRSASRLPGPRRGSRLAVLAVWLSLLTRSEARLMAAGPRAWRRQGDAAPEVDVMLATLLPRERDMLARSLARLSRLYPREGAVTRLLSRLAEGGGKRGRLAGLPGSA